MRIAVTGASGLIGTAMIKRLSAGGHEVLRLVRRRDAGIGEATWNPDEGTIDSGAMEGCDAVVHLAGEPVASGRWTARKKQRILRSRVGGTSLVASAMAEMARPPRVLIAASATGIYGDRGEEVVDERSPPGAGFLADVCRRWEAAAEPAAAANIRVVNARLGVVLSCEGGALRQMIPVFRAGLGGRLGNGRQYISWIALDDAVRAIEHLLAVGVSGPVNLVSPAPRTNAEFVRTLGRALRRPAVLPAPAFVLRLALGEMADEALLASARVAPTRLVEWGFRFDFPSLDVALAHVLGGDTGR